MWVSAAAEFYRHAAPFQFGPQRVAVIALDFDDAVLDRAAGAAALLQILGQGSQRRVIKQQAADCGDGLAAAAVDLALNARDAVALRRTGFFADAGRLGFAAVGAVATLVGGVDEAHWFRLCTWCNKRPALCVGVMAAAMPR